MNFKQSLLDYLSTTNDPTMKEVFDRAIQYAREQDPEFVKSYQWPVKTSEPSEKQVVNANRTGLYKQVSPSSSSASDERKMQEEAAIMSMQAAICCGLQATMPPDEEDGYDYFYGDDYPEYYDYPEQYDHDDYPDLNDPNYPYDDYSNPDYPVDFHYDQDFDNFDY